jgi:cytolysin-activating lysine-acyltransferase
MSRSDISLELLPGGSAKLNEAEARVRQLLADVHRLADSAKSRDAGALHQRKGPIMSEPSSGGGQSNKDRNGNTKSNGNDKGPGASAAPSDTIFTKPAPEGAGKKVSEVLGEIVWLMSQSPLHKQFFISDLEWLVMTPVLLQQFRLFYDDTKPIGVAFWGTVDGEVEERLKAGTTRLRPQDWKSGDRLWVVEVIAPFGGAEEMVKDLKAKVFPAREMKFLAVGVRGREVRTL